MARHDLGRAPHPKLAPFAAQAADKIVIGDIDCISGLYAGVNGPRAVEGDQNGDRRLRR